jgi:hypothetical protein
MFLARTRFSGFAIVAAFAVTRPIAFMASVTRCYARYAVIWSYGLEIVNSRYRIVVKETSYEAGLARFWQWYTRGGGSSLHRCLTSEDATNDATGP